MHQLGLDLWRDVVVRNRRIRERLLGMLLDMVQVGGWVRRPRGRRAGCGARTAGGLGGCSVCMAGRLGAARAWLAGRDRRGAEEAHPQFRGWARSASDGLVQLHRRSFHTLLRWHLLCVAGAAHVAQPSHVPNPTHCLTAEGAAR